MPVTRHRAATANSMAPSSQFVIASQQDSFGPIQANVQEHQRHALHQHSGPAHPMTSSQVTHWPAEGLAHGGDFFRPAPGHQQHQQSMETSDPLSSSTIDPFSSNAVTGPTHTINATPVAATHTDRPFLTSPFESTPNHQDVDLMSGSVSPRSFHMTPNGGQPFDSPHSTGPVLGLGLNPPGRRYNQHHRQTSLGQMGVLAQSQHPSVLMPLRLSAATSPAYTDGSLDSGAMLPSMSPGATVPGRVTRTGTTPNLANMAIYTGAIPGTTGTNNAAFVRSLSQQHGTRSSSPSGSIGSTSWNSPNGLLVGSVASSGFSPVTSVSASESRFPTAPSMDSRDTSMDSLDHSASVSRASSISEDLLSVDSFGFPRVQNKKKVKLLNLDRKRICERHEANPKLKQDELATLFGVERSTVSKVLKEKERWLAIEEDSQDAKIVKHRQAKFPEVEKQLMVWVQQAQEAGQALTDAVIKEQALNIARAIGGSAERFKASGGWVEKFRVRSGLRKGDHLPATTAKDAVSEADPHMSPPEPGPSTLLTPFGNVQSPSHGGRPLVAAEEVNTRILHDNFGSPYTPAKHEELMRSLQSPLVTSGPLPNSTSSSNEMAFDGVTVRTTPTSKQKRHYDAIAAMPSNSDFDPRENAHSTTPSGSSAIHQSSLAPMLPETKRRRAHASEDAAEPVDEIGPNFRSQEEAWEDARQREVISPLGSPFNERGNQSRPMHHRHQQQRERKGGDHHNHHAMIVDHSSSPSSSAAQREQQQSQSQSSSFHEELSQGVKLQHPAQGLRSETNDAKFLSHPTSSDPRSFSASEDSGIGALRTGELQSPLRPLRLSDIGRSTTSPSSIHQTSNAPSAHANDATDAQIAALASDFRTNSALTNMAHHAREYHQRTPSDGLLVQQGRHPQDPSMQIAAVGAATMNDGALSRLSHLSSLDQGQRRSRSPPSRTMGGEMHVDEPVTLAQARHSLDVVLQFLNESDADIIPRSHFLTLGSLHGSLAAAAERSRGDPQPHQDKH